jgi:hypothetical protein
MRRGPKSGWWGALALLWTTSAFAQGPNALLASDPDIQRLDGQVRQFFGMLAEGRVNEAFDGLLTDSPALERSPSIADLKKNAQEVERRFGPHLGHEQVRARRVGQDVIVLKYLYKCERFPVVWYFTFYRTADVDEATVPSMTWRLITVRFDTQIELLALEE